MEQRPGIQISTRAFAQSALILLALMILAGVLTLVLPAGRYARATVEGREVILPDSYQLAARPDYPAWRWLTAPIEVLGGPQGLTIITILIFILMIGASFAVLGAWYLSLRSSGSWRGGAMSCSLPSPCSSCSWKRSSGSSKIVPLSL
jgi:hypothetical protein